MLLIVAQALDVSTNLLAVGRVPDKAFVAAGLTVALALAAWGLRAVTFSGACAGLFLTFVLCFTGGPAALAVVTVLFLLTFASTLGFSRKLRFALSEPHEGRRASQIFANLGAAALCAAPIIYYARSGHPLLIGVVAALAEATADTVSSEVGQSFAIRPVLITTFRRVAPGTNGGITPIGTLAGMIAAFCVCYVATSTRLIPDHWFWIAFGAAVLGMFLDSLLGATLERPDRLGNDSVNFASSAFSAFVAIGLWFLTLRL